jgi:hypothetical protein
MPDFVRNTPISLRNNPLFNEKWLQSLISSDPSLLGLGELDVIREEKIQPGAGRLDLLLHDEDEGIRYEVELQLGQTDPSHIIRTIEYWDLERRQSPQYSHVAVIVAESITSRFFNVISLFNRAIPIIAVQVQAIEVEGSTTLVFTKILDLTSLGTEDDEVVAEPRDRTYWTNKASIAMLQLTDEVLELIRSEVEPTAALKYNKYYIGLEVEGLVSNFMSFRPRKHHVGVEFKIPPNPELATELEEAGIPVLSYQVRWGLFRIQLSPANLAANKDLIYKMIKMARENFGTPQ